MVGTFFLQVDKIYSNPEGVFKYSIGKGAGFRIGTDFTKRVQLW